ncbi:ATP-binding protein [Mesorhizobium sp. ES1-4]|uniref:ATP-binding protein n=1 Tax=Mesorhizobium sp. ES1-4 TaxID=2876627 RepID=UPI001CCAA657|nr:ATP-binding protein [Mesorhizobium sp. ES1-4]MBZ9799552.1 response regulator [Mesorhizobium sp. ES1-4]
MAKTSLSIRSRLVRVVVTVIFGGMLSSVTFFTLHDFRQSIMAEQARLRSSAAAFAAAAANGVRAGDAREVLLVLRAIRELPDVRYAAAYDKQGLTVAEIGQATELVGRDGSLDASNLTTLLTAQNLSVAVDIHDRGEVVGSISFVAEISRLRQDYLMTFAISLLVGLGLIALTALVARRQIGRVIAPLGELARDFAEIGRRSDLTRRINKSRDDEVGVLVDAFNEMFSQIERRDALLQNHRDALEHTVEVRTSELRAAKDDAERANAAKSDFLATMSHEIRTPMNGMLVMAEMLSVAPLAPKHLRYAEVITRCGKSLLHIINDILDFSKIEAGKLSFESIPFSLDMLIEDAASLFAERAREKGLTIAIFVSAGVPAKLVGDPTRLSQVIGNLLNNGLKFTDEGGVLIEANCVHSSGECAQIEVHVRDTGVGIPADKLERIFERFSQADQSITRRFGGTGLGLSISRRLVEGMGGEISVSSRSGEGSDFHFTLALPIAEPAKELITLSGHSVAIRCNELTTRSLKSAFAERGAEIVEDRAELTICDASGMNEENAGPVIYLRTFADTKHPVSGQVLAEIAAPVRRVEIDTIATGLRTSNWSAGTKRVAASEFSALPDLRHLKVLAVDDSAVNREVLSEALSAFKIVTQLADSAYEAIESYRDAAFDIVFMDCSMPGMDGYEATARFREIERSENRKPARIIALTAHVRGDEAQRWQSAGMDAYMSKPFTIAQMRSAIEASQASADPRDRKADDAGNVPLISPDALSMFRSLSGPAGDRLAAKVFGLFLAHAPVAFGNLRQAVDDRSNSVATLAHALKSMSLSAGAARAAMLCDQLENAAKAGALPNTALRDLDGVLLSTLEAMNSYLSAAAAA